MNIKSQFPIFKTHSKLHFLDNAASTQTPQVVLNVMNNYYTKYRSNVHRGLYDIAIEADENYHQARMEVAKFLNCDSDEVVFTSGATHGLNLLAHSLTLNLKPGDNVVLTRMEHHANLVPWQQMSFRQKFGLRYIELNPDYTINLESAKKLIDNHTKIVSFAAASNVLGTISPSVELIKLARAAGAVSVLDAAQASAHFPLDVRALDCDYLVFSGHKTYGPTGVGILYGKKSLLEKLEPLSFGGEMIDDVSYTDASWNKVPYKFEAGTPPVAEVIGLGAALRWLQTFKWSDIIKHEQELTRYLIARLSTHAKIIGPTDVARRIGTVSFIIPGIHPHDIAEILNRQNVAIRVGHHCAQPLHKHLMVSSTARASLGIYNDEKDVDALIKGILAVKKLFS